MTQANQKFSSLRYHAISLGFVFTFPFFLQYFVLVPPLLYTWDPAKAWMNVMPWWSTTSFTKTFRTPLVGSFCSYLWNPHTVFLKRTWHISCLWTPELQVVKSFTCLLLCVLIMMVCKTPDTAFVWFGLVYFILYFLLFHWVPLWTLFVRFGGKLVI